MYDIEAKQWHKVVTLKTLFACLIAPPPPTAAAAAASSSSPWQCRCFARLVASQIAQYTLRSFLIYFISLLFVYMTIVY